MVKSMRESWRGRTRKLRRRRGSSRLPLKSKLGSVRSLSEKDDLGRDTKGATRPSARLALESLQLTELLIVTFAVRKLLLRRNEWTS